MPIAKWAAPGTRSSNLAGTALNSLANGSESTAVTYDNSTDRIPQAMFVLKIPSITPSAGGSLTLRVTVNDGTDTMDRIGGDTYNIPLTSGASAKTPGLNMIRLYPVSMRLSVINNSGVALPASGIEMYVRPYGEEI